MNYFEQETDRLLLRKLSIDDCELWEEFFYNNDHLHFLAINKKNDGDIPYLSKKWIEIQLDRYENTGFGHLAAIDKATGMFIGQGGILQKELNGQTVHEIGYSIKPRFWGKGYATEIALHLKSFAKTHKISPQVISIIHVDNIGSQKVAQRNGMQVLEKSIHKEMPVYIYGVSI